MTSLVIAIVVVVILPVVILIVGIGIGPLMAVPILVWGLLLRMSRHDGDGHLGGEDWGQRHGFPEGVEC